MPARFRAFRDEVEILAGNDGGILGVILIVILIVWLLRGGGYVGGF